MRINIYSKTMDYVVLTVTHISCLPHLDDISQLWYMVPFCLGRQLMWVLIFQMEACLSRHTRQGSLPISKICSHAQNLISFLFLFLKIYLVGIEKVGQWPKSLLCGWKNLTPDFQNTCKSGHGVLPQPQSSGGRDRNSRASWLAESMSFWFSKNTLPQ